MSERATAVNGTILAWARNRAGLSLSEAGRYLHKQEGDIAAWEAGEAWPTYRQLESLVEGLYHRPVALFFLPEPPDELPVGGEFRTLPDVDVAELAPDTRYALRLAMSFQASLTELAGGINPSERCLWRDLAANLSETPVAVAARLRRYLGITLEQQREWRSTSDAMEFWRASVEGAGVFVFKRSFRQRQVSGFCVTDDEFPIIMINNSTPFSRQIFTLLHEVAHLLYGVSSITTLDGRFVDRMSGEQRSIEVLCNRVAAEVLVPADAFPWNRFAKDDPLGSVSAVANDFSVSREVILRRLLDEGWVDAQTYGECVQDWADETEPGRGGEGGSYYNTQAAYFSDAYLRLAFSRYHAGLVTIGELAEHLGVKARNIPKLEEKIVGRL